MPNKSKIRKILIIKFRYIGDTVLTTPLIRALKEGIPDAQIDIAVNRGTESMLWGHPFIGKIWTLDYRTFKTNFLYAIHFIRNLQREGYDLTIDLTNNDRSALLSLLTRAQMRIGYQRAYRIRKKLVYTHFIQSALGETHTVDHHLKVARFLGLSIKNRHPEILVERSRAEAVEKRLFDAGINPNDPFVLIHPGARKPYKRWPIERFSQLGDDIIRKFHFRVIIGGGPGDLELCDKLISYMKLEAFNLAGKVPLRDLPALIQRGLCLIGNDSAPIHIATSVKTPTVSLFGPTRWEDWAPRRPTDQVLAAEYPCRPCGHSQKHCPLDTNYCMASISYESVWHAVAKILSGRL
ncbi:MAG: putative lipopolysaccharide heptosyltransferase III [Thermodesulfobacteriota bacterium]